MIAGGIWQRLVLLYGDDVVNMGVRRNHQKPEKREHTASEEKK